MGKYEKAIAALGEIILKGTPEAEQIKKQIEELEKLQKENKGGV